MRNMMQLRSKQTAYGGFTGKCYTAESVIRFYTRGIPKLIRFEMDVFEEHQSHFCIYGSCHEILEHLYASAAENCESGFFFVHISIHIITHDH